VKRWLIVILLSIFCEGLSAQNLIINGSFEALGSGANTLPIDWSKCHSDAYPNTSTPDVMPGVAQVTNPPHSGSYYLNLVCTPVGNNHSERIHGSLSAPLDSGTCYELSVYLMMSSLFYAHNGWLGITSTFNQPIALHIALQKDICASSFKHIKTFIHNESFDQWVKHTYYFVADSAYQGIRLYTAYYNGSNYHGHVLVDDISILPIEQVDLDMNFEFHLAEDESFAFTFYEENSPYQFVWNDTVLCEECEVINFQFDSLPQYYSGVLFDTTNCFWRNVYFTILPKPIYVDSLQLFEDFYADWTLPNVITPNADLVNDVILVPEWPETMVHVSLYNRWGVEVYHTHLNYIDVVPLNLSDGVYYIVADIQFRDRHIRKSTFLHLYSSR
jgi:hypothetical protein